jgi:hypothetical protein
MYICVIGLRVGMWIYIPLYSWCIFGRTEHFMLHTQQPVVELYCCGDVSAGQNYMVEGFDCKRHLGYGHLLEFIEYGCSQRKERMDVVKRFGKLQSTAGLFELYNSGKVEHCRSCLESKAAIKI